MKTLLAFLAVAVGLGLWLSMRATHSEASSDVGQGIVVLASATEELQPPATEERARLVRHAQAAGLRGRILGGAAAKPLAGVELNLLSEGSAFCARAVSDARGEFAFGPHPSGTYTLRVEIDPPYRGTTRSVLLEPDRLAEATLALPAEFDLTIQVTATRTASGPEADTSTVQPISADVGLYLLERPEEAFASTRADGAGRARLDGIPEGRFLVRVRAEGHVDADRVLDLDPERYDEDQILRGRPLVVRLQATTASQLRGVVRHADGSPLAGTLVCLDTRPRSSSGQSPRARRARRGVEPSPWSPPYDVTDAAGRFTLPDLADTEELALLMCTEADGAPLLYRRELSREERALGDALDVRLPPAREVVLRCVRADGQSGHGTLELSDGIVTYDLAQDDVARRIPSFEDWNRVRRSDGALELRLAAGTYKALFRPSESTASLQAFVVTITEGDDPTYLLGLDD